MPDKYSSYSNRQLITMLVFVAVVGGGFLGYVAWWGPRGVRQALEYRKAKAAGRNYVVVECGDVVVYRRLGIERRIRLDCTDTGAAFTALD